MRDVEVEAADWGGTDNRKKANEPSAEQFKPEWPVSGGKRRRLSARIHAVITCIPNAPAPLGGAASPSPQAPSAAAA